MAITKFEIDSEYGRGTLTESRVTLTMPGTSGEKLLYRFIQLSDLHISCFRPEDDEEAVELAKSRMEFWQWQAGYMAKQPDGSEKNLPAYEAIELVGKRIRELEADMIFFTGDTVDFQSVSNFRRAGDFMRSLGKPWVMAAGNHDSVDENSPEELQEAYKYAVGTLDDFTVHSLGELDIVAANDGFVRVTAEQVEKLKAQLEKGRPTIVLLHAPILTASAKWPVMRKWGPNWMVGQEGQCEENMEFRALLNAHRDTVLAVFAGHVHTASGGGEGIENLEEFDENEVLQYTAAPAFEGFLRVIDVLG